MSEPIQEDGPWSAFTDIKGDPVIASDDFTHDVWLRPYGDFGDVAVKLAYCEEIARRLNEWKDLRAAAEKWQVERAELYQEQERLRDKLARARLDAFKETHAARGDT